ncbi:MAG: hypothetical protein KA791_02590 [Flavobacteriales bacterium]|nr:hypothetical protein [Flavobacteriales bacterium]
MRTLASVFALAAATILNAAVHTVSNEPGYPAQHTNLTDAYAAASPNDTLYITGSATGYGDINLEKPLALIGTGYNNGGAASNISTIYCSAGSSGSKFIGLSGSYIYLSYFTDNTDMLIERSRLSGVQVYAGAMDGLIVKHCVIQSGIYMNNTTTNALITSNIIQGQVQSSTSPSVLISNNIFANNGSWALGSISYAVVSNNIFYGSAPSIDGNAVENCAFNNNLSFGTTDDDLPPTGTNVGSGNQVGVDPLFVNVPDFNGAPEYDYQLQAGSTGNNAGTDNTDLGVYGGGNPLQGVFDGRARIPLVTNFIINNSTIAEGGSLNVTVEGRKND